MAGTSVLAKALDASELSELSTTAKEKLDTFLTSQEKTIDEYKGKFEKSRVNAEQRYFEIEAQLKNSNQKLETESAANQELTQKVRELETKYNETSEKLQNIRETQEDNVSTTLHLTKVNEQLETEKRELALLLEKRNRELDTLNDELKELSKRASDANTAKCEAMAKLDDIRSQEVNREYQIKRLTQEKENMQKELDWTRNDAQEKTNELMTFRREKSTRLLELQFKLEEKTEENNLLQATLESVKKTNADQAAKIDSFIQKIKDLQDSHSQAEEQYSQEIQARIRLADLYKQSSTDAENQVTELTGAVKELQKLLKEAAAAHTEMEKARDEVSEKLRSEISAREKRIESLEQECANANELVTAMRAKGVDEAQVEEMFPTAAATSKMLKSGMTLVEIYNEYATTLDAYQKEKEENRRLNTYMDQILQEIEEKAPILRAQRTDYENALQSIDRMTRQLTSGMVECKNLRQEADEKHRKLTHLQRENQKQQQQIQDLSKQVKYLVKEIEEVKGGRVVRDETVSSSESCNSSQVISQNLVTFGNIEELQEQNQKLLVVVRDLSDKREEEEKSTVESRTKELRDQLEQAQTELTDLKEARDRQADMVESIVRQRDMYRVLLQQTGTSPTPGANPLTSTPYPGAGKQAFSPGVVKETSVATEQKLEEANKALKQLQEDFTSYRKEKLENEKIVNDQYEKAKQDVADFRVQNAKLSSQLDFSAERYKVLQGNADGYRKEIALLRDRSQKYSTSIAKHEQTINSLRQDMMTTHEKLAQSEARVGTVKQERDLIRASEQRLAMELDSLRKDAHSQTMLMANLQAIQNNLERNEHETKHRLGKQVQILERDNTSLGKRLETEERLHKNTVRQLENQVQELRKTIGMEVKSHQTTKDKLTDASAQIQDLKNQLSSTSTKLAQTESQLSSQSRESGSEDASKALEDLKLQLTESRAETESVRGQLQTAKQHVEQYKTVAQSVQDTIQQQNQASKEFQTSLELKLNEATDARQRLDQKVTVLEQERQELLTENIRISEESHSLNADLRKQLSSLQNEFQEAVERRKTAVDLEAAAKLESERQIGLAADAQEKYERELMLHAADVEALTAVKKELEGFNNRIREKEEAERKLEKELQDSKTEWQKREALLTGNLEKENSRVKELITQTRALHEQMGKLSHQVISVQERAAASPKVGASATSDDSSKSSEQLLEVVRYLRKEKEIAEGKLDVVETESVRLKQRCDQLEKQLEAANRALAEELEKLQADMQTVAQHADLMHKVESNNLLQDSNRLLREERDQLTVKLQEAEAKMRKLEENIKPLQEDSRATRADRESLQVEKVSLQNELERWKARTNSLIEQSHKTDPEEHKKLVQEREKMRKQLMTTTDELHKARADAKAESSKLSNEITKLQTDLKAETTKASLEIAKLQKQLDQLKQEKAKFSEDVATTKLEAEEKGRELEEKVKTINQLKKIGRKYKEQAEKVGKEFDEYRSKHEGQQQQQQSVQQASTKQLEAVELKLKESESKREQVEQSLRETETKREELEQKLKELESSREEMDQKLKESLSKNEEILQQKADSSDTELLKLKEELTKSQQDCNQAKEEAEKLKEEKVELEKKVTRSNTVMQTAKTKIHSMKETTDKLTAENAELRQKMSSTEQTSNEEVELRIASLTSQYESQIRRLEADISQLREAAGGGDSQSAISKLEKDNSELQAKVQQLQRQLDSSQKVGTSQPQVHVSRTSVTAAGERGSSMPSEAPKTANIRPIASSPAAIKPQPMPIQPSAATKATASIRPMAMTPTTVSVTPTATVMPTTVSQQDLSEGDVLSPVQQLFPTQGTPSRPTQQVLRVTPQAEPTQEASPEVSEATSQSETGVVEPQPSTSVHGRDSFSSSGVQGGKRQREDTESPGEDNTVKRSKVTEEQSEIPSITITDENAEVVDMAVDSRQQAAEGTLQTDQYPATTISQQEQGSEGEVQAEEMQAGTDEGHDQEEEDDDDVIIVASDDEDDYDDDEEEEEEEDDDEDDEEEYIEEIEYGSEEDVSEAQGEDYPEADSGAVDVQGHEDSMQTGDQQQAPEDEDDVVIVVEEPDSTRDSEHPSESQVVQPTPQSLPPPLQQHAHIERQISLGRNQLTPFMLGGNPGAFEDGDDCTVPSTPTLVIPRRGDGFAEAVSSPQVHHQFIFGSGGEPGHTLSGLAQLESQAGSAVLGMGMDDTSVDLSQLEEGSGRSVPSTPLQTSAPVPLISESSESLAGEVGPSLTESELQLSQSLDLPTGEEGATQPEDDGDDEALELEQGEEESQEREMSQPSEERSEVSGEVGAQGDATEEAEQSTSQQQDRAQDAGKKKIQRIMWDSSRSMPAAQQSSPQPIQPHYHGRGQRSRGTPPMRGNRGNFTRGPGSGGPVRRPMRGRGMYTRRPPMY